MSTRVPSPAGRPVRLRRSKIRAGTKVMTTLTTIIGDIRIPIGTQGTAANDLLPMRPNTLAGYSGVIQFPTGSIPKVSGASISFDHWHIEPITESSSEVSLSGVAPAVPPPGLYTDVQGVMRSIQNFPPRE